MTDTQQAPQRGELGGGPADDAPAGAGRRSGGWISTLTGNLGIVLGTIVFSTLAVLTAWLPPRGRWVTWCARGWSRSLLWSAGVAVETRFTAPLPADRTFVFMANHQSLYDIPALFLALPGRPRFLAKRGLFQIPLFGWALKAGGFISIDRGDRSRAGESFGDALREMGSGASAVVFPEGTRSTDGNLLPFQRGGFLLALKSGLPIVPVGIHGSLRVRGKNSLRIRSGRVVVSCGRPLEVTDYGVRDKARLMEDVRRRVLALASA